MKLSSTWNHVNIHYTQVISYRVEVIVKTGSPLDKGKINDPTSDRKRFINLGLL